MKNKLIALLLISAMALSFAGCQGKKGHDRSRDRDNSTQETVDEKVLAEAKTVHDVSYLIEPYDNGLRYSECKKDEDLYFYFNLLKYDEYIKVNYEGQDYLIVSYSYSSYGLTGTKITGVEKKVFDGIMHIEVDLKTETKENEGCFPNSTTCRLILKLDEDIRDVVVSDLNYQEYDGGYVTVCNKMGILDKDLNFVVPLIYDDIFDFPISDNENDPVYYRVCINGVGQGLLDENFNQVLSTSYYNLYYYNPNKYIAMIEHKNGSDETEFEIVWIDGDENVIKSVPGFLECENTSHFYCMDGHLLFCDPTYGPEWGKGVMDEELNIIIEPIYYNVFWLDEGHYNVENFDYETAHFSSTGEQATDFKPS